MRCQARWRAGCGGACGHRACPWGLRWPWWWASAGISATFNAPLGGCFFTMELLFRSFATRGFAFVAVSSVVALLVAEPFLGASPAFAVPGIGEYRLGDWREMFLYIGLGVLAGLAGAAALFAGVARAPITSVVMIFELARNYALILPVMTAAIVATGVVRLLSRETIYTEKLIRRGIDLLKMGRARLVAGVRVGDVMSTDFPALPRTMPLCDLAAKFVETAHHGFPVLDEQGKLYGVVTLSDLRAAEQRGAAGTTPLGDICSRTVITAYPDETLAEVLARAAESDVGRIPVVDPNDDRRLVGVLRRASLVQAWRLALARGEELL